MKLCKHRKKLQKAKSIRNFQALLPLLQGATGVVIAPVRRDSLGGLTVTVECSLRYRVSHPAGDRFYREPTDRQTFAEVSEPLDAAIATTQAQFALAESRVWQLQEAFPSLQVVLLREPSELERYFARAS